jgi:hypothetical protein
VVIINGPHVSSIIDRVFGCKRAGDVNARVAAVSKDLTPEKALIFRIVHRDNILWILDNGLQCKNSKVLDPNFVEIGNSDLISKRGKHPVVPPPSGTLSDYVPFYFTPFSPMMYNIKTGWGGIRQRNNDEIVIMVSSLRTLQTRKIPFLFTDRHAYLVAAQFYSDLARLDQIDWDMLQRRDFRDDPDDQGALTVISTRSGEDVGFPLGLNAYAQLIIARMAL